MLVRTYLLFNFVIIITGIWNWFIITLLTQVFHFNRCIKQYCVTDKDATLGGDRMFVRLDLTSVDISSGCNPTNGLPTAVETIVLIKKGMYVLKKHDKLIRHIAWSNTKQTSCWINVYVTFFNNFTLCHLIMQETVMSPVGQLYHAGDSYITIPCICSAY